MQRRVILFLVALPLLFSCGRERDEDCVAHLEAPFYPQIALVAHITGQVAIHVTIDSEGRVDGADVISGPPILGMYAAANVWGWRFAPSRIREP